MRMTDSGHEAAVDPAGPAGTAVQPDSSTVALPAVPFGEWPSPITAAEVASGQVKVSAPMVLGSDAWWQQGLPDEGGRTTVMHSSGGKQTALLAAPWNVRTRVHEYGGRRVLGNLDWHRRRQQHLPHPDGNFPRYVEWYDLIR